MRVILAHSSKQCQVLYVIKYSQGTTQGSEDAVDSCVGVFSFRRPSWANTLLRGILHADAQLVPVCLFFSRRRCRCAHSDFFRANSYIGKGQSFMVKLIAERVGVECPSFFTYVLKYSMPVLPPIFALAWFLFFR
jgi:hypothetical protein